MEQRWIPVTERLPEKPEKNIYFDASNREITGRTGKKHLF